MLLAEGQRASECAFHQASQNPLMFSQPVKSEIALHGLANRFCLDAVWVGEILLTVRVFVCQ